MPKRAPKSPEGGNAATEPAPVPVAKEQLAFVPIRLADLVLNPELQCRAKGLDADTVDEYAAAMRDGAVFPPVKVIDVDGTLFLVDGWHREAASRKTMAAHINAIVETGTWEDALVAAAQANPTHGLRRTNDDKRKAVILLLSSAKYAGLSGRKLGEVARVSHTHVDAVRQHYGLKPGQVLTVEMRKRHDGEATGEWVSLQTGAEKWVVKVLDAVRRASVDELARQSDHNKDEVRRGIDLRLAELQTEPWPWSADKTDEARDERAATLDDIDDIRAALTAEGCPRAKELLRVLTDEPQLRNPYGYDHFDRLAREWARRPALLAELAEARSRREADVAANPGELARRVTNIKDPAGQLAAFLAAPPEVQRACYVQDFVKENRDRLVDGEYRAAWALVGTCADCADPTCTGWTRPATNLACVRCGRTADQVAKLIDGGLHTAAVLLNHDGFGICPVEGVIIDAATVDLVELLERETGGAEPAWFSKVPSVVRSALRTWRERVRPTRVGYAVEPEKPPVVEDDGELPSWWKEGIELGLEPDEDDGRLTHPVTGRMLVRRDGKMLGLEPEGEDGPTFEGLNDAMMWLGEGVA